MSYGKKDEDADLGLVKVDRTQVFQEGSSCAQLLPVNELHDGWPTPPFEHDANKLAATQLDSSTAPRFSRDDAEFS